LEKQLYCLVQHLEDGGVPQHMKNRHKPNK
jgi:hypothetical protein